MPPNRITRELDKLKAAQPGRRFEEEHERLRISNGIVRFAVIGAGLALMVLAAVTFWLPGPNFVFVLLGLALIGGQWRFIARQFDRGEVWARRWNDERWEPYAHKRRVIALGWFAFAILVALCAYGAWRLGLLPGWLPLIG